MDKSISSDQPAPLSKNLLSNEDLKQSNNPGFLSELARSFAFSAVQAPTNGVVQLYDYFMGTKHLPEVQLVSPCKEADFGSANWHAQQIGAGLGTAVDFLLLNASLVGVGKVCAGIGRMLATAEKAESSLPLARNVIACEPSFTKKLCTNAASGFIFDGIFHESKEKEGDSLLGRRLAQAVTGAATFSVLAASSEAASLAGYSRPVGSAMAGVPAGMLNVQLNSLLAGDGFAGFNDTNKGAYSFLFTGGVLGLMHGKDEPKSNNETESIKNETKRPSETKRPTMSSDEMMVIAERRGTDLKPSSENSPNRSVISTENYFNRIWTSLEKKNRDLPEWQKSAAEKAWEAGKNNNSTLARIFDQYKEKLDSYLQGTAGSFYKSAGDLRKYIGLFRDLQAPHRDALYSFLTKYYSNREDAFNLLNGLKTKAFVNAYEQMYNFYTRVYGHARGAESYAAESALKFTNVFGNDWRRWVSGENPSLSAKSSLPFDSARNLDGLGSWLLANSRNSYSDLSFVGDYWSKLSPKQRELNCRDLIDSIKIQRYGKVTSHGFAKECAKWNIPTTDYAELEARFLNSQAVPSPVPLEKSWKSGDFSGRFLPRSDARGMFLGEHTDCCQHPGGVGEKCAFYGQEAPNSCFFVVEDQRGRIIAQSWAWVSSDGGLCFDNIEGKSLGPREAEVVAVYEKAAHDLRSLFHTVTAGVGNSKVHPNWKAASERTLRAPADYRGYSDSQVQMLVGEKGEPPHGQRLHTPPNENLVNALQAVANQFAIDHPPTGKPGIHEFESTLHGLQQQPQLRPESPLAPAERFPWGHSAPEVWSQVPDDVLGPFAPRTIPSRPEPVSPDGHAPDAQQWEGTIST